MGKKIVGALLVGAVMLALMLMTVYAEQDTNETEESAPEKKYLYLIKEAYLKMHKYYYKEVDPKSVGNLFYRCQFMMMNLLRSLDDEYMQNVEKLTYSTINMIVTALKDPSDEFSKFIHKDYLKRAIRENLKSSFAGIGIEVEIREPLFFIVRVYDDSPAAEAGVLKGDQLLEINHTSVEGWTLKQIEKTLRIPEGESVTLKLLHPEEVESYEVTLVCRIIRIPSIEAKYYEDERVGYINIKKFRDEVTQEFQAALDAFAQQELLGLVLDLRGNSGGDETQVLALSGLFLPDRTLVVYFLKREVGRLNEKTKGNPLDIPYPVAILVNKDTGSSAEIFAGTMQHYGKATVIGTNTKGHGSLKNTIGLSDGSALFLITSRTYLPNDKTFDGVGITPDIIVSDRDEQLQAAFQYIHERVAAG